MLTPFVLEGHGVRLEPLSPGHAPGLAAAAAEGRDSYGFTPVPDGLAGAEAYLRAAEDHRLSGEGLRFAVLQGDRVVGSTGYFDLQVFTPQMRVVLAPTDALPPTVLEIGGTWYAASAQRTGVNTAAKLLLLTQAFDRWGALRVTLKTDARNARSRAAIERLGASFEGVRRVEMRAADGGVRDSAYYSIVAAEWPAIRDRLIDRLR